MPQKYAILLDGTIGVGKTTYGRLLSQHFEGIFLDGDDFKTKGKPWYCSTLSTCRQIREAGLIALQEKHIIFIGRPMRCLDWIYFFRHLQRFDVKLLSIGLQAPIENIITKKRNRYFSSYEVDRMEEMIQEGYGARPYSDLFVRNDESTIKETASSIATNLDKLLEI